MSKLNYEVIRKSIKRANIRVKEGRVIVTVPRRYSFAQIDSFVSQNESWILNQLNRQKIVSFNDTISIFGRIYTLRYGQDPTILNNEIYFKNEKELYSLITKISFPIFESRFQTISRELGFSNLSLKVRKYASKWGSCTPSKNLVCLNLNLSFTSIECLDAIIYHELAHFKVMNHSKDFYHVLETWFPSYKQVIKELKKVNIPRWEESI